MHTQKVLAVDIGGTKIHMGVFHQGRIVEEMKLATAAHAPRKKIINSIIMGIEQLMEPEIAGIGIGIPGLVDEEQGIVYDITNIPSWKEVPLKKILEDYFKKPVYLTNDANTFILGEKMFGRAKGCKNVVGITLGTGFGVGIIIDEALYSGTLSSAGEFGSIQYLDQTIEAYCSGKFFLDKFGISGAEVHSMAQQGDRHALEILKQLGHHIGEAIKLILYALSPEAVFLGGSVSACYPYFKEAMEESVQTFPFKRVLDRLVIACSKVDNAALLGAAALFEIKHKNIIPLQEILK
ncbi:ROK family protein [Cesiribacter sp. SM1]|uniref:ROK family protein n=1 Tax=Cesiribacter sp. SM1 TaxID=2861196 RepID=UPI001CD26024|nr:ROK family protein [Cesiribacter sp. SM1]